MLLTRSHKKKVGGMEKTKTRKSACTLYYLVYIETNE